MNVFHYIGTDVEHISFDDKQENIIEKINSITTEKITHDEFNYLAYNSCLYGFDKVLFVMKKKFPTQYNHFVKHNIDIVGLFGVGLENKDILFRQ